MALAGAFMALGVGAFVWSGAWRRATWLLAHHGQVEGCRQASLARGASAEQARRYCECIEREIESRWTVFEYGRVPARAMRTLVDDGTTDRCAAGGPAPPAGSADAPAWRRRTWEPWLGYEVRQCASQPYGDSTVARRTAYCECLYAAIQPRWSLSEYRRKYDEATRALSEEGERDRCWRAASAAPDPATP